MSLDVICWNCNKVAFRYLIDPKPGDILDSEQAVFDDGSHPEKESAIECQYCKKPLWPNSDGTSVANRGE